MCLSALLRIPRVSRLWVSSFHHRRFDSISHSSITLFAALNGDEMRNTFNDAIDVFSPVLSQVLLSCPKLFASDW